jgi:tetratricopeptide (TPR) repeat protein
MKVLTALIHSLKAGEVHLVRLYYKMQVTSEVLKRHLLFDLIKNKQVKTDEEACKIIYNKKIPYPAYSQLKKRLKSDILNILLLQDSKSRFVTPYAQAEFDVRRMVMIGDMLITRGITNEGIKVLQKAAKLSEEYELYSENIVVNDLLVGEVFSKSEIKNYHLLQDKISKSALKLNAIIKAKDYYNKIRVPTLFKLNEEIKFKNFVKNAVDDIKIEYDKTSSVKVAYYYYYIQVLYNNLIKDYSNALIYAKKFLEIINNNKCIYSKRAIAAAYLQIGFISLQLGDYKLAIKNTEHALKNFKSGLINELTSLEVLFLACFYDENWPRARQILDRALHHPKLHSNEFLPAKWHYFRTCLLFKEKKFEEATHALNDCTRLLDDRTGWLYGFKIMDILLAFENTTEFLVDNKVANFRKILRKQNGVNIKRPRLILKILETLVRKRYDFKETAKSQGHLLSLLENAHTDFAWEPMGYELVKFHEWFNSKLTRRAASVA